MFILPNYTPLIMLAACVIFAVITYFLAENIDSDVLPIITIILSVLSFILMILLPIIGTPIYEEEYDRTINLYALDSGSGVKGTFLLGSGTVNDIQYYTGYTNIGENDYKQIKFDASKSILRLNDEETPRAEIYKIHQYDDLFGLFLMDRRYETEKSILYIPTDGLKNTYSIN